MDFQIRLIGFLLSVYLFIVFQFLYFQRKNRIELEKKLKEEWGTFAAKEYNLIDWKRLKQYHQSRRADSFPIDAMTWNDLDMDAIFCQLNHTHSSIGEEYLYDLLHTPVTDSEILKERERLITFFTTHEKERLSFECLAESIGEQQAARFASTSYIRVKKESISDLLFQSKEIPECKAAKHVAAALFFLVGLFLFFVNPFLGVFVFIFALAYGISLYYKEKAKIADDIHCFKQIIHLLNAIEKLQSFHAPELKPYLKRMIQAQEKLIPFKRLSFFLLGSGVSGSPFDIFMDYIRMLTHIDLILFGQLSAQFTAHKDEIRCCVEQFGFLESMIAAASYRKALPEYCLPTFLMEKNKESCGIELTDVYHPMLKVPVKNSISVKKSVLLTGSNASGKSTFLKTTAIAALLAQTIHTVPAAGYLAPFYQIYSSMAIRDNLSGQDSYYMVEIKSLKRILDAPKEEVPVLCFIDEVLRGTNTVERIAASTEILKSLSKQQVLCFAATHDIELTQLLNDEYEMYYFSEQIQKEDILFDYQLKKGVSATKNAIRLIQQVGYDKAIVDGALWRADTFLKTGHWQKNCLDRLS